MSCRWLPRIVLRTSYDSTQIRLTCSCVNHCLAFDCLDVLPMAASYRIAYFVWCNLNLRIICLDFLKFAYGFTFKKFVYFVLNFSICVYLPRWICRTVDWLYVSFLDVADVYLNYTRFKFTLDLNSHLIWIHNWFVLELWVHNLLNNYMKT